MDFRAYLQINPQGIPCPLPSPISLPCKYPGGIYHEYTTHVGSVVYYGRCVPLCLYKVELLLSSVFSMIVIITYKMNYYCFSLQT